ncbi:MAG: YfbR-like 5'-deoxynucleotidase [Pseudomonadota bacterium]
MRMATRATVPASRAIAAMRSTSPGDSALIAFTPSVTARCNSTGDLPTPVKYSPAMKHASANLESEISAEMLGLLPEVLKPALQSVMDHQQWPEDEAILIKTADRLAAWLKCRAELRYGNREFEQAAQQIEGKLNAVMTPELRYFLDHFGPAFELTLDSLMCGD